MMCFASHSHFALVLQDLETLSTIHKDVSRTLSELHFFSSAGDADGGRRTENPAVRPPARGGE
jgi:hypothetical protein